MKKTLKKSIIIKIIGKENWNKIRVRKYKKDAYSLMIKRNIQNKEIANHIINKYNGSAKYEQEIEYLKENGFNTFPYSFSNYKNVIKNIQCGFDEEDYFYVIHNDKRMYVDLVEYAYLLIEQNVASPHRYFTDDFMVDSDDVFVDIGGAEGIMSLDVVDIAKHIYIIEAEQKWKEKLERTFEPYKEKITIISAFAGNRDTEDMVTVDNILRDVKSNIFIKMDVEGNEDVVIEGMKETLAKKNLKLAICTYHKFGDDEKYIDLFNEKGFDCKLSEGYMVKKEDPYFIKGLLRVRK